MIKILYPTKKPSIRLKGEMEEVFCLIRKRWVSLTPEEWVRQNFLLYLTEVLLFPASLIAVEKQLISGDIKRRFDIVVYDNQANAFMLVECKEMNIPLTESVLHQVLGYNIKIKADWVVITNGVNCAAFRKHYAEFGPARELPVFK